MDPDINYCLVHMILVQNFVQFFLNLTAFFIGPLKWHYFPPLMPIGLITTVFSIYCINRSKVQLIIWYIIFLFIGFFYRIYVLVDMFIYRNQLLTIIKNCDEYALIDIEENSKCNSRLDFKIISLNLINSIIFHFAALLLDIFLISISIQLRSVWESQNKNQLSLLTVQYDKKSKIIDKYLRNKYGTFKILAEDGNLNDEIEFIKKNLFKTNYFQNIDLKNNNEKNFGLSESESDFYKTAESNLND